MTQVRAKSFHNRINKIHFSTMANFRIKMDAKNGDIYIWRLDKDFAVMPEAFSACRYILLSTSWFEIRSTHFSTDPILTTYNIAICEPTTSWLLSVIRDCAFIHQYSLKNDARCSLFSGSVIHFDHCFGIGIWTPYIVNSIPFEDWRLSRSIALVDSGLSYLSIAIAILVQCLS